ncbi:MAG: TIM barrel protein [archaeon]
MPEKLLFGTAGIPFSTKIRSTENGIKRIKELGLGCMELEFVHSVNISRDVAPKIKSVAVKAEVELTVHAPYYINLNALERPKFHASVNRILSAARIGFLCGAKSVVFHAGFYLQQNPVTVSEKIKAGIKEIEKKLLDEGIDIWLRPETTGKATQWGSLEEIVFLSEDFERVLPCVDFSHLHARSAGKNNSFDEFTENLSLIESKLGRKALDEMHIHLSGIAYSDKGERNHLILKESDMNYKDLLKVLKDFKVKGWLTCESPNLEEDALLLKKEFDKIK